MRLQETHGIPEFPLENKCREGPVQASVAQETHEARPVLLFACSIPPIRTFGASVKMAEVAEIPRQTLEALTYRSSKRSHDFFLEDQGKPVAEFEEGRELKLACKVAEEYAHVPTEAAVTKGPSAQVRALMGKAALALTAPSKPMLAIGAAPAAGAAGTGASSALVAVPSRPSGGAGGGAAAAQAKGWVTNNVNNCLVPIV
jgi:hypothetical protein